VKPAVILGACVWRGSLPPAELLGSERVQVRWVQVLWSRAITQRTRFDGGVHGRDLPNESPDYRVARNKLLQREVALRREMEAVAADIRTLPPGGPVPDDYEFDHIDSSGTPAKVRMSLGMRGLPRRRRNFHHQ
jgi:hypothetical protein